MAHGPAHQQVRAEFEDLGGVAVAFTAEDLKTFAVLRHMIDGNSPEDLDGWLAARQPAHHTELFAKTLGDVAPAMAPITT